MILDGFKVQMMKFGAKARTPEKITEGIWNNEGDTAKYFNSSLRKKKESKTSKEYVPEQVKDG